MHYMHHYGYILASADERHVNSYIIGQLVYICPSSGAGILKHNTSSCIDVLYSFQISRQEFISVALVANKDNLSLLPHLVRGRM